MTGVVGHTTVDVHLLVQLSVKLGRDERRRRKVLVNQSHVDGAHFLWELQVGDVVQGRGDEVPVPPL